MIFIVQPDLLALDPSHTVHLQGPPRAIYTSAPLGLQFLARTLQWPVVWAHSQGMFVKVTKTSKLDHLRLHPVTCATMHMDA